MENTIICRTGWCSICHKENRPHSQDLYLAYGSSHKDFDIRYALGNGTRGFTPHLYKLIKPIGENVVIEKACSFCDVDIWEAEGIWNYKVYYKRSMMFLKDWNSLVLYRRDHDYEI